MSSAVECYPMKKHSSIFSWELIVIKLILLVMLGVALQKPCGSLVGRLALEQKGFNLFSYNMRQHKVYAIAIGPRGGASCERGVWVRKDGTFRIDNLSVGEYELKIHVPGFATSYDSGIFIEDGKIAALPQAVKLHIEQPSVNVASNAKVFTTKEQPHFWLNMSGCSEATVKVYRSNLLPMVLKGLDTKKYGFEISADLSCYKPYDSKSRTSAQDFFSKLEPVKTWQRSIATDSFSHEEFKFEKTLSPGDYFAVATGRNVEGSSDWNLLCFSVTDLGLVVKQDPDKTLVRAIDLNTLQPVPGAKVAVYNQALGKPLASGVSASDGFVQLAAGKIGNGASVLVTAECGQLHAYGGLTFYSGEGAGAYRTMFYTDRPVYRLGQTVYFKGICRANEASGAKNPGANLKLSATIEDPDNNQIWSGNLSTSEHGTFNGLFEIPADGKTGAYQFSLKFPDGSDDSERFEVAEYRKPEYQVEVVALTPRITAGARGRARVKATYYFGAPVANAKVKYTIYSAVDWNTRYSLMERPDYYSYFDGWDSDDQYLDTSFSGDYISEGYTVTDANGEATVEFATKRSVFDLQSPWDYDHYDHKYKLEAEVTDISRLSVLGNGSLTVTNGDFELFVKPSAYVSMVGDPLSATVRTIAYDGKKPQANLPVHLRLYRRLYDRVHYSYKGTEVYEDVDAVTDASGAVTVNFKTKPEFPTDTYEILATAKDSQQNVIADESSVWVVSNASAYSLPAQEAGKEPLSVKLDKDVYKIGETAKVMITAPVTGGEGAQAIVTIEGPKLFSYRVVNMKATAQMVAVPITDQYAPNVYVDVTFIGKKHQYYEQSQMIKVSPKEHFLQLSIESDRQKYKPGDVATYTVRALFDNGKPAPKTEVSLGIVDESIYSIRPDTTPDIRSFFYNKRQNSVTTMCSFPEEYSGGPNKIEPRVRKDFRDTCAWLPVLVTDDNGIAKASVKLPDNLTTWRATAVAINMKTDVGQARQKVISTQDLILRLGLPRFFCQGDSGLITAVVHNYTDKPQVVNLTLAVSEQLKLAGSAQSTITVDPDKAERYSWPVAVVNSGKATISCKAVCNTAGDAMQVTLPVHPLGVESFVTKSGLLTGQDVSASLPAQLPADCLPGSGHLHVYLSSSVVASMFGNFSSLIDYPYGCTEQTMSKLMPAVVAIRLNQALGVPLSAADKAKFGQVYKQSMEKLDGYQHDDGGWGWWANDTSSIYLTGLVLDGYKLLQEARYPVSAARQTKGLAWLRSNLATLAGQLNDPLLAKDDQSIADKTIDLARASYVLSRYKTGLGTGVSTWALAHKDRMTPEALSYFTMAFAGLGDVERAGTFFDRLIELGNTVQSDSGVTLDWSLSKQMCTKLGLKQWSPYSYRYTDVETTALALEAISAVEPDNSERLESIKRWILLQRGRDGWDNTKTTAEVLRAVMQVELRDGKQSVSPDFTADISGASLPALSFNKSNAFEKERDLVLQTGGRTADYVLHKRGVGSLYYTSVLTYYKHIQPGQYISGRGMPDGLKLSRQFFRLVPTAPDSDGNIHFTASPLNDGKVRAGETVLMKVYVDAPQRLPYVCLEAPLPSGAEVVSDDARADAKEAGAGGTAKNEDGYYSFGGWWWTHQDVMDDHLAFFVTDFSRGRAELHQMMRMELPGKFQLNPITLNGMYSKAVRAYSQADQIEVVE